MAQDSEGSVSWTTVSSSNLSTSFRNRVESVVISDNDNRSDVIQLDRTRKTSSADILPSKNNGSESSNVPGASAIELDPFAFHDGDGRLVRFLKHSLSKTVSKCLEAIKFQLFATHYAPVFQHHPRKLQGIHDHFNSTLLNNIMQEVNLIFKEENLTVLLNTLDDIVIQNQSNIEKIAWRPCGIPFKDIQDHLVALKLHHRSSLMKILQDLETKNISLEQEMHKGLQKLHELNNEIQERAKYFQKLEDICSLVKIQEAEQKFHQIVDPDLGGCI